MRTVTLTVLLLLMQAPPAVSQSRSPIGPGTRWSLAAVGDVIMNRRIIQYDHPEDPAFHEMANLIRGTDAAFLNLEQSAFRLEGFEGWPAAENGGNYEVGAPETVLDLVAMGFDLFNRANNHTTDYGVAGLRATNRFLDEQGLTHAGSGENLGWASRPGYLETRKGRIALIGMASTFTPQSVAGTASLAIQGRPGLNPLRVQRRVEASPATVEALREIVQRFGDPVPEEPSSPLRIFGETVTPGDADRVVEWVSPRDRARILKEVVNATDQADYVIVNSHSHQPGNRSVTPPEWMTSFAHDVIDAGADAFIIHGPHQLRGIEVYQGRPIFYSLGNFIFQNETIDPLAADMRERYGVSHDALAMDIYDARFRVDQNGVAQTGFPTGSEWYESVIAVSTFDGDELVELRLYPIELGWKAPRSRRGTPRLAPEPAARRIIQHLADLSETFGTEILYEDGVGVWRR
jgi:poly-gamma-glutamate capsule biosynthesis protein CapA/YwtB (metallophosphatase superfamily)